MVCVVNNYSLVYESSIYSYINNYIPMSFVLLFENMLFSYPVYPVYFVMYISCKLIYSLLFTLIRLKTPTTWSRRVCGDVSSRL